MLTQTTVYHNPIAKLPAIIFSLQHTAICCEISTNYYLDHGINGLSSILCVPTIEPHSAQKKIFIVCCYKNKVYTEVEAPSPSFGSAEKLGSCWPAVGDGSYHIRTLPSYVLRDILFHRFMRNTAKWKCLNLDLGESAEQEEVKYFGV